MYLTNKPGKYFFDLIFFEQFDNNLLRLNIKLFIK